ncbi:aldose epimerase family protein [Albibacterium bauzanense]|uniref:Aldose 1-epimerase n=1 Tax=Albibacterium bauzanense TaxID=653929 RepID=A0A4R1LUC8_9SPHI|nr:aldose epimerase family protein [Albibacterium bauzanense]TCK80869.1 aldose 1-epimerase [Albibacterium bauzanense]
MMINTKCLLSPLLILGLGIATGCTNNTANQENNIDSKHEVTQILDSAFEKTINGKEVKLYTLENAEGRKALITNYGGRLVSMQVPDKTGNLVDVIAGFDSIEGYQHSTEPYFGATIGRFGNRIAKGKFSLDGKDYQLFINNPPNTLHGGKVGFQDVVWDAVQIDQSTLELNYLSNDMEEGFPGNLKVKVTYELNDQNELKISYEATTDKNTFVNLTNHAFFNLNGDHSGTILNHLVKINADQYTPVDSTLIPIGEIITVKDTPFDFTSSKIIGKDIETQNEQLKYGNGYDHNFVLNEHAPTTAVAVVLGDISGIEMSIYTDQPGLQFYSGNFMQGKNTMKGNHKDDFRTAFAMETQHFPDSPNQPSFPSTLLKPGMTYNSTSIYQFNIKR